MTKNPNELTDENSFVILIDHQPCVALSVRSIDPGLMINNVAALARASRDLGIPTVLTTVGAKGSILVDPIFKEISAISQTSHQSIGRPRTRGRTRRSARLSTRRSARS